jgi:DNA invertase Pin-like site-specific DNA recombinase
MSMKGELAAYGYIRVSSLSQGDADGPKRQRDEILGYAEANGFEVTEFYEDLISGTKESRPALGRMLYDLEQTNVPVVIVESLSRMARDLLVQEVIIKDLKELEVSLVSVQDGVDLDSDDPNRTLVRQLMGAIAEFDRAMTVWKLKAARDRKSAELGRRIEGRKPIYPDFLRDYIWKMRLSGHTYARIADQINGWNMKTTTGGCFYPALIRQILCH